MCEEEDSCPFLLSDCGLQGVADTPCCKSLCSVEAAGGRQISGRAHQQGLARFLTNLTRPPWFWDDSPAMVSQPADVADQRTTLSLEPIPLNLNTTFRLPSIRQILASQNFRPGHQPDLFKSRDWDDNDGPNSELAERATGAGNYEAIIIGITLLILCLLVIAVIFVLAIFRLRNLRLLGGAASSSRPTTPSNSTETLADVNRRQIEVAYISEPPPPSYQLLKPICQEAPPSYEQSTANILVDEAACPAFLTATTAQTSTFPVSSEVILHV